MSDFKNALGEKNRTSLGSLTFNGMLSLTVKWTKTLVKSSNSQRVNNMTWKYLIFNIRRLYISTRMAKL